MSIAASSGCNSQAPMSSQPIQWPTLTDYPCTTGRAATSDDVKAGRAVFVLQADGKPIGQALGIKVPQYAYHIDEQTKERNPCIIIQAEEARGERLIGCRTLADGQILAALFHEFEFLGDKP